MYMFKMNFITMIRKYKRCDLVVGKDLNVTQKAHIKKKFDGVSYVKILNFSIKKHHKES